MVSQMGGWLAGWMDGWMLHTPANMWGLYSHTLIVRTILSLADIQNILSAFCCYLARLSIHLLKFGEKFIFFCGGLIWGCDWNLAAFLWGLDCGDVTGTRLPTCEAHVATPHL